MFNQCYLSWSPFTFWFIFKQYNIVLLAVSNQFSKAINGDEPVIVFSANKRHIYYISLMGSVAEIIVKQFFNQIVYLIYNDGSILKTYCQNLVIWSNLDWIWAFGQLWECIMLKSRLGI